MARTRKAGTGSATVSTMTWPPGVVTCRLPALRSSSITTGRPDCRANSSRGWRVCGASLQFKAPQCNGVIARSFHLILGQRREGVDDLLAAEEERIGLESNIDPVGIPGVDRRLYRPTPKTRLMRQNDAGDRRDVSLLRLGDLLILHGVRILQVLLKVLPDSLFVLSGHFAVFRGERLRRRPRARHRICDWRGRHRNCCRQAGDGVWGGCGLRRRGRSVRVPGIDDAFPAAGGLLSPDLKEFAPIRNACSVRIVIAK